MTVLENYRFGRIEADGHTYTEDIKVIKGRVVPYWWRNNGHRLAEADIQDILAADPDILVIGTGNSGRMEVPDNVHRKLVKAGIQLVVEKTAAAVDQYNRLQAEGRDVAGGFHLTC